MTPQEDRALEAWENWMPVSMKSTATKTWRIFTKNYSGDTLRKVGLNWTFGYGVEKFSTIKPAGEV